MEDPPQHAYQSTGRHRLSELLAGTSGKRELTGIKGVELRGIDDAKRLSRDLSEFGPSRAGPVLRIYAFKLADYLRKTHPLFRFRRVRFGLVDRYCLLHSDRGGVQGGLLSVVFLQVVLTSATHRTMLFGMRTFRALR